MNRKAVIKDAFLSNSNIVWLFSQFIINLFCSVSVLKSIEGERGKVFPNHYDWGVGHLFLRTLLLYLFEKVLHLSGALEKELSKRIFLFLSDNCCLDGDTYLMRTIYTYQIIFYFSIRLHTIRRHIVLIANTNSIAKENSCLGGLRNC